MMILAAGGKRPCCLCMLCLRDVNYSSWLLKAPSKESSVLRGVCSLMGTKIDHQNLINIIWHITQFFKKTYTG